MLIVNYVSICRACEKTLTREPSRSYTKIIRSS